jgi:hypothetical protein
MEALIETRNEYVEHIQDILGIAISKRINKMWEESGSNIKKFQSELTQIKKWNNNIINEEYKKIVKYTKCKYLYNLIKIIIINTIKIKIYEYRNQFDNIKIKIPAAEDYIHKCYMNIASFSWKNAYLFVNKGIKDVEYQNNLNIIEENIKIIIKKTFRDFIPYDEILDQIDESLTDTVSQFNDESDTKNTSPTKSKEIEPEIEEEGEGESEEEGEEEGEGEGEEGEEEAGESEEEAGESEEGEEEAGESEEGEEEAGESEEESEEEAEESEEEAEESEEEAEESEEEGAGESEEEGAGESEEEGAGESEEDKEDKEYRILKSEVTFNNTLQPLHKLPQPPQELPQLPQEIPKPPQEQNNESNAYTEEKTIIDSVEPKPVNLFEPIKTQEEFVVDKDNITNNTKDINDFKSLLPEPIMEDDNASITSDMSYIKEIHISDSQDKKKKLSFF